jgi:hypothetical protein
MITKLCDFCQFPRKNWRFSQKQMLWTQFVQKLAVVWAKNANIFSKFFVENIEKIITSVPGHPDCEGCFFHRRISLDLTIPVTSGGEIKTGKKKFSDQKFWLLWNWLCKTRERRSQPAWQDEFVKKSPKMLPNIFLSKLIHKFYNEIDCCQILATFVKKIAPNFLSKLVHKDYSGIEYSKIFATFVIKNSPNFCRS